MYRDNKIKYAFHSAEKGVWNNVHAKTVGDCRFRLVSDHPLTMPQIELIQELLSYPQFPYQSRIIPEAQRCRLGKNTLKWSCYDV